MYVVRHNHDCANVHLYVIVVKAGTQYDIASGLGKDPTLVGTKGQKVGFVIALQVWEYATVERFRHKQSRWNRQYSDRIWSAVTCVTNRM